MLKFKETNICFVSASNSGLFCVRKVYRQSILETKTMYSTENNVTIIPIYFFGIHDVFSPAIFIQSVGLREYYYAYVWFI